MCVQSSETFELRRRVDNDMKSCLKPWIVLSIEAADGLVAEIKRLQ